jgi:hypothetical protein
MGALTSPNPILWVSHLMPPLERLFVDYQTSTYARHEVDATATITVVQYFSNFSSPALPTMPPSAPMLVNREVQPFGPFPDPTHSRHLHH